MDAHSHAAPVSVHDYYRLRTRDVTVGSPSRALFTWNGPVVTDLESRALAGRGDPQWDESMQWLHENITAEPIHCRY
ncbi:hypothetical protein HYG77_00440 [Rhodococcus sp. ZPP]|uniref:hypothetical protein n=1 Tax=Rhodococcus sp. ZPP TaxID=2749906 RepID=UPI001AD8600A|nr:hypothetical protein [Rhodococcus sp. ZPP]QTJ64242.1 hypothetical protein HYG77_00440 [Rhodococcus sp. ZPP]